ncbi:DUF4870 family protein [Caulobacter sp. KR2-114]|uniref:DUF4870 family protein n=1 Tax=Caulobacter sp. KR2-114 TaxID=3400912 RepID=UPI003C0045D6
MSDVPINPQPPQPAPPPMASTDERTLPIIVYVLYLAGLFTGGLTTLVGLVIAMGSRAAAPPLAETHYRFQIRTGAVAFAMAVLGSLVFLVGLPLLLILVGVFFLKFAFLIWGLAALYVVVRSIVGLVRIGNGEAYPTPDNWLL